MKTHTNLIALGVVIVVFLADSVFSQGSLIFQHSGASDPTIEGFSFSGTGAVGPVVGDFGVDAWSTAGGIAYYSRGLTPQEQAIVGANDWALSISLRMVDAAGPNGSTFIRFATGTEEFALGFGLMPNGDPLVRSYGAGTTYVLAGAGPGYHSYLLKYQSLLGTASLWVDNVERLSNISAFGPSSVAFFRWGAGQSPDYATANWNLVSLKVVPEPSSVALSICAGLLLIAHATRRRRV